MTAPLQVLLVGPLPPPSGGMANQTRQLSRLLEAEGVTVRVVQTNSPYRPQWVAGIRGVRAVFRMFPYILRLAREAGNADVVHVMANSGWAWHLFAAPAIRIAASRDVPVIVNYRGGLAAEFLASRAASVRATLARAAALVVPSRFLLEVFANHGIHAAIIPNVVDVATFRPAESPSERAPGAPHVVVARNLEHLYGNDLAIRALALLRGRFPEARLTVAGSGPELGALRRLAIELGIADAVHFPGRLEVPEMAALYQSADVLVNPSRADNAPNSILEALACGVPVVSTSVGGVPFLVEHGRTAWLVKPDEPHLLADGIARVLSDAELRRCLVGSGLSLARACSWDAVRAQWLGLYRQLVGQGTPSAVH